MSSAVSCPVLKVPEILLCLADMHVHLTADDIKQPTATTVRHVLEVFVDKLMGVKRDDLHQPQFHAIHLLSNPELHDDSLQEMTTLKAILRLLRAAGVSDASMSDVMEPTYVRMKLILSCLINLIKHREDVLEHYTHYSQQWETLLHQQAALEEDVVRLQNDRDRQQPQYDQDKAAIDALTADIATLTTSITDYNKKHLAVRDDIRASKAQLKALSDPIHTSKAAIASLTKDNAASRQHILRSPERLKRTLADLTNLVAQGKADVNDGSARVRELNGRALLLGKMDGRLKKSLSAMRDIETLQTRARFLVSQGKETERNIAHLRTVEEALRAEEADTERKATVVSEKAAAMKRSFEKKKMEARMALEEVEEECEQVRAKGREEAARREEAERALERVRRELSEGKVAHESAVRLMRGKGKEMESAVKLWHGKLLQGMAAVDQPHAPMTPKAQRTAE